MKGTALEGDGKIKKRPTERSVDELLNELNRAFMSVPLGEALVQGLSDLLGNGPVSCYGRRSDGEYQAVAKVGEPVPEMVPAEDPLVRALVAARGPVSRAGASQELQASMTALHCELSVPFLGGERLFAFVNLGSANQNEQLDLMRLNPLQPVFELARQRLEFAWLQEQRLIYARQTAHDLHQPLKIAIPMLVFALREKLAGPLTDQQEELLGKLKGEVDKLEGGFDRLFSFYPFYEALLGRQGEWKPVNLTAVCRALAEQFRPYFEQKKGVAFHVTIPEGPCWVRGHGEGLHLALYHVVHNAWRDTTQGQVQMTLQTHDHGHQVVIADSGPGIPEDLRQDLWNPFARLAPEPDRGLPRSGVGLALVAAILHEHHGQLRLDSQAGHGTTCTLTLPSLPHP